MLSATNIMQHLPLKKLASATLLASLTLSLSSEVLSKDFYRWTDENGTTHYSALPPTDKAAEKVHTSNIKGNPTAAQPKAEDGEHATDKESKTDFDESANAPETAEVKAQKKENCKRAKFNLKTLKEKPRIRVKEGDDYRYIGQKERKDKIKKSEKDVKKYCN